MLVTALDYLADPARWRRRLEGRAKVMALDGMDGFVIDDPADRAEVIMHMLQTLEMPTRRLTAWELQFLESVSDQFTRRGSLSERQFGTLERIYAEKTE